MIKKAEHRRIDAFDAVVMLEKTLESPLDSSAKTRGFHTQLDEGPETP